MDVRVAIIGAGAVGGTTAALLDRAGHDVTVTARGEHLAAIREHGIRLTGGWGAHTARVEARETLIEPADLVILTTKAQDAASALQANAAGLGSGLLLVIQNGLDGVPTAREVTGRDDIVGGLAMYAASYLSPGEVSVTTPLPTFLGGPQPALGAIATELGGAMPVEVLDDLDSAKWTKLIVNQLNALPAITGLSVQETIADDGLRRVLTSSMREAVHVAHANGVRFASLQGLSDARLRLFAAVPERFAERVPRLMSRRMGDVPNPGSTLQSIRRGQRTEIDFLHGAVVARAGSVPVPVNAAIVAMVHEVERTGTFLAPDEVVRRARG